MKKRKERFLPSFEWLCVRDFVFQQSVRTQRRAFFIILLPSRAMVPGCMASTAAAAPTAPAMQPAAMPRKNSPFKLSDLLLKRYAQCSPKTPRCFKEGSSNVSSIF